MSFRKIVSGLALTGAAAYVAQSVAGSYNKGLERAWRPDFLNSDDAMPTFNSIVKALASDNECDVFDVNHQLPSDPEQSVPVVNCATSNSTTDPLVTSSSIYAQAARQAAKETASRAQQTANAYSGFAALGAVAVAAAGVAVKAGVDKCKKPANVQTLGGAVVAPTNAAPATTPSGNAANAQPLSGVVVEPTQAAPAATPAGNVADSKSPVASGTKPPSPISILRTIGSTSAGGAVAAPAAAPVGEPSGDLSAPLLPSTDSTASRSPTQRL